MSIYRNKHNLIVIQNCREDGNCIKGDLRKNGIEWATGFEIYTGHAEQLFTETETQQMIESAVAEDRKLMQEEMQRWKECANRSSFENQKLIDKNNRLLYEIEELKAKVPQPIEITQELAEEIELYKESYGDNWLYFIVEKVDLKKFYELIEVMKNGYKVKHALTLHEKIKSILETDFSENEWCAKEIIKLLKEEGLIDNHMSIEDSKDIITESRFNSPHLSNQEILDNLIDSQAHPQVIQEFKDAMRLGHD